MEWGGRGVLEHGAASPMMAETRQGAWAEGRSDQRWMGTIQEAVACGRSVVDPRRQETGSTPRRESGCLIRRRFMVASPLDAAIKKQPLCRSGLEMDPLRRAGASPASLCETGRQASCRMEWMKRRKTYAGLQVGTDDARGDQ
jgi:hypothetical protein